jgi:hypothetical protein
LGIAFVQPVLIVYIQLANQSPTIMKQTNLRYRIAFYLVWFLVFAVVMYLFIYMFQVSMRGR